MTYKNDFADLAEKTWLVQGSRARVFCQAVSK